MATGQKGVKMFEVINSQVVDPSKWAETARKNAEDYERQRQFLIKVFSDVSKYMKKNQQTLADIRDGKIRREFILRNNTGLKVENINGNLIVSYNGKRKELQEGSQEWYMVEVLAEAMVRDVGYEVNTVFLQERLEEVGVVEEATSKTIRNIRDRINKYFDEKIIDSDAHKKTFWFNRDLMQKD